MKKLITFIFGLAFALPALANAASFVIVPPTGSYVVGDTVLLNFSVNPAGATVYSAMLDARFSSDVFEVVSFSLNDHMIALKQTGYDAIDNTTGVLTKTGGYPGGINSVAPFGTIVLRAKGSGVGTFTVLDNSKLLDSNSNNQQNGNQTVSFTIALPKASVITLPVLPATTIIKEGVVREAPKTNKTEVAVTNISKPEAPVTSTQLAAVAEFVSANSVVLWMLGLLATALGYRYIMNRRAIMATLRKSTLSTPSPAQKEK